MKKQQMSLCTLLFRTKHLKTYLLRLTEIVREKRHRSKMAAAPLYTATISYCYTLVMAERG